MPQIDALTARATKSSAHLKSIGASTNFWEGDFRKRQTNVTADTNLNTEVIGARTSRLQLGFAATNTIEIKTDGTLTFSAGGRRQCEYIEIK